MGGKTSIHSKLSLHLLREVEGKVGPAKSESEEKRSDSQLGLRSKFPQCLISDCEDILEKICLKGIFERYI